MMSDGEGRADSLKKKTSAFLNEFFEKGEAMIMELIVENEKLRSQIEAPLPADLADLLAGLERREARR